MSYGKHPHDAQQDAANTAALALKANKDGSDLTNPQTWREALSVQSESEARSTALALVGYRSPAPAIHSDGVTSNRRMELQPGDVGNVAGSPATFVVWVPRVPESNPSTYIQMATLTSTNSGGSLDNTSTLRTLSVHFEVAGRLRVKVSGESSSDYRILVFNSFRSTYSGQSGFLTVVFPNGDSATDPTIYWNDADITDEFTLSTNGTAPNWMSTDLDCSYFLSGYNWPEGDAPIARLINAALSSDDITHLVETGRFPAWAQAGGSMVNRIPDVSRNSDFSAGATDWADVGATSSIVSGALDITTGAIGNRIELSPNQWGGNPEAGRKYRVTADISNFSATATIGFQQGASDQFIGAISGNGKVSFEWTSSISGFAQFQIRQKTSGSSALTVDNIVIEELGLIADPIPQPGDYMDDGTRNGLRTQLVGMTAQTSAKRVRVPIQLANSSGSAVNTALTAVQPANSVLVAVDNDCGAAITLGTASGGTQILGSTADGSYVTGSGLSAVRNDSDSARTLYVNHGDGSAGQVTLYFDILK